MTFKSLLAIIAVAFAVQRCTDVKVKPYSSPLDSIAGNEDVGNYLKSFKGRGELTIDSSKPTPPSKALNSFKYPADLAMELVLSEPQIVQPVEIGFDHRGRLWVVQYNQYPYPKGLKITSVDNYLRVTFDKVPAPPPAAVKGADKITFFEDTDGDGKYDKSTDAITGLNIATSVAVGRGSIWVLNPPYLLAYPDPDDDGIPNGAPVVHLSGFGMQDTHSVANSLTWGPDGWLYGAQGSTTTSTLNSSVTKDLFLQGQAIWRYNPGSQVLERFAEGGGNNPFNVEIDEKGRLYSGSNGVDRGPYYKQGGYYIKSWGKHGPLSNPYAFGYLPNMLLTGETKRFTHAFIKYEGGSLPARYHDKMIAINPYLNYVELSRFETNGSGFKNIDEERILQTSDVWFRPVDIQPGPDGAVYLADWYDSRLSHIDPRDNWDKTSGRIYRLRNKDSISYPKSFDLSKYSNEQLVALLLNKNKWYREQALLILGNRKDSSVLPALKKLLRSGVGQTALEALWAIHASGGFSDEVAVEGLHHKDPFVRMWSVRLLGDANKVSPVISKELTWLANGEEHPEVLSQLASSAKRLPSGDAIPIIKKLWANAFTGSDPDIPLLTWWAVETRAVTDRTAVLSIFKDPQTWKSPIVHDIILKNLMQRYVMEGGNENYNAAAALLKLSPSTKFSEILVSGLLESLHGRNATALSPDLIKQLKPFQTEVDAAPLALALRQGQPEAVDQALLIIADRKSSLSHRLAYITIFGETNQPKCVPALLKVIESSAGDVSQASTELKRAALETLQQYDNSEIGARIFKAYPSIRADTYDRAAALELFATRLKWAEELLTEIVQSKLISKDDVTSTIAGKLRLLDDPTINKQVDLLWPATRSLTVAEKTATMARVSTAISSGKGDVNKGHALFLGTCGGCHHLSGEGGRIGPDLGAYNRNDLNTLVVNVVDPNADIREGFELQRIVTTDGRVIEGRIVSRNGGSVIVQPPLGGKELTFSASQVKEIKPGKTSIMPERLLDKMSDQEIRDMFAYIRVN